jgi:hypothetical protein
LYTLLNICKQFFDLYLPRLGIVASLVVGESRHLAWTEENRIVDLCVLAFFAIEPLAWFVSTTTIIAVEATVFNLAWTECRTYRNRVSVPKARKHTNIFDGGICPFIV